MIGENKSRLIHLPVALESIVDMVSVWLDKTSSLRSKDIDVDGRGEKIGDQHEDEVGDKTSRVTMGSSVGFDTLIEGTALGFNLSFPPYFTASILV